MLLILAFAMLSFNTDIRAQEIDSTYQAVSPWGGVNQLLLEYCKIKFNKEQRKILRNKELEFIYLVTTEGCANLHTMHRVDDRAIQDSFFLRTQEIPAFNPRIVDGVAREALYFVKFTFPRYQRSQYVNHHFGTQSFFMGDLEDFEFINTSGSCVEFLFGGSLNQFAGGAADHLEFGGGIKFEFDYTSKKSILYGLHMSVNGNKLKNEYSKNSIRDQLSHPATLFVGGIIGKWFNDQKFNTQVEINYAVQNVTEKVGDNDPEWVQFKGWSSGIVFNYLLQLGKEKPMYYYGFPSILKHDVNLHLGVRQLFLSNDEANGTMIELGASYRMIYLPVSDYKLNDDFMR